MSPKTTKQHPLLASSNQIYRKAVKQQKAVKVILRAAAYTSIFVTFSIVAILLAETVGFLEKFQQVTSFWDRMDSLFEPRSFGVLPIIWGTLLVSFGACFVSVPLGLATAFYLSEYASTKTRRIIKPIIELLAGIPSVVFGYFALIVITPMIRTLLPETQVFNALSASIVVGIMTLPLSLL